MIEDEDQLNPEEKQMSRRLSDHAVIKNMEKFMEQQGDLNRKQIDFNSKLDLALFGNETETGLVKDVKEMRQVFNSVDGFKKVSVILLKGMIIIGAAIGAFYVIVEFIKKISKHE